MVCVRTCIMVYIYTCTCVLLVFIKDGLSDNSYIQKNALKGISEGSHFIISDVCNHIDLRYMYKCEQSTQNALQQG